MNNISDERIAPRIEKDSTVFIELDAGTFDQKEESDIVICKSLDLSSTGLQVVLDREINEGSVLRLCLDSLGRAPIFVVAQVMWQRENQGSGEYHVGFMLLESRATDFDKWQQAIAEMFDP